MEEPHNVRMNSFETVVMCIELRDCHPLPRKTAERILSLFLSSGFSCSGPILDGNLECSTRKPQSLSWHTRSGPTDYLQIAEYAIATRRYGRHQTAPPDARLCLAAKTTTSSAKRSSVKGHASKSCQGGSNLNLQASAACRSPCCIGTLSNTALKRSST